MSDYIEDPQKELAQVNQKLAKSRLLIRTLPNHELKRKVMAEVAKLEEYKEQLLAVFDINSDEILENEKSEEEVGKESFPILEMIKASPSYGKKTPIMFSEDLADMYLYLELFDRDMLSFFSERKLKLDFKFSLERDAFYNKYQQLMRKIDDFRIEMERLANQKGDKNYDEISLQRKLKMKNILLIDITKFFRSIRAFCEILLKDISGDKVICLNSQEEVVVESYEDATGLKGLTVQQVVCKARDVAQEVIDYINIPDFS